MRVGIIGFPKTGKTTVFNALTGSDASTDPFGARAKANLGVARVRDDRLAVLARMWNPKKVTPATIDYVDVPGFEPGTKGLSGYLAEFRGTEALLHVVRAFEDEAVPHAFEGLDPGRDVAALEDELLLQDLATLESRLERIASDLSKKKDPDLEAERAALEELRAELEAERPLRGKDWPESVLDRARGLALLTLKPMLHVLNLSEATPRADAEALVADLRAAERPRTGITWLLGQVEAEIARLPEEDATAFLAEYGLREPTADRVAAASFALLDLVSFLTAGEQEVRAWPIRRGTVARKAAGKVHSDIERGFIRAEVVAYDDLVAAGSWSAAREAGTLRLEGRDHVLEDGDVVIFRFNV